MWPTDEKIRHGCLDHGNCVYGTGLRGSVMSHIPHPPIPMIPPRASAGSWSRWPLTADMTEGNPCQTRCFAIDAPHCCYFYYGYANKQQQARMQERSQEIIATSSCRPVTPLHPNPRTLNPKSAVTWPSAGRAAPSTASRAKAPRRGRCCNEPPKTKTNLA